MNIFQEVKKLHVENQLTGDSIDASKIVANLLSVGSLRIEENLMEIEESFEIKVGRATVKFANLVELAGQVDLLETTCGEKFELCFLSLEEERELLRKMVDR